MSRILVLNGPNLGRLGTRDPEVYGDQDLAALERLLIDVAREGTEIDVRQTDDEGTMLGWLHSAIDERTPVVLNAGAWTHYDFAVRDAAAMVTQAGLPLIEVHISNPHAREEFRHTSVLSAVATGTIAGFGLDSYVLAIAAIERRSR